MSCWVIMHRATRICPNTHYLLTDTRSHLFGIAAQPPGKCSIFHLNQRVWRTHTHPDSMYWQDSPKLSSLNDAVQVWLDRLMESKCNLAAGVECLPVPQTGFLLYDYNSFTATMIWERGLLFSWMFDRGFSESQDHSHFRCTGQSHHVGAHHISPEPHADVPLSCYVPSTLLNYFLLNFFQIECYFSKVNEGNAFRKSQVWRWRSRSIGIKLHQERYTWSVGDVQH